jgi:hypothetical protein
VPTGDQPAWQPAWRQSRCFRWVDLVAEIGINSTRPPRRVNNSTRLSRKGGGQEDFVPFLA